MWMEIELTYINNDHQIVLKKLPTLFFHLKKRECLILYLNKI